MPTANNLNEIPTEYLSENYMPEAQLALAYAGQELQNTAMIKSRYEDLLGLDLTTNKSKETLSTYMKGAEEQLQKIAGTNMLSYGNASHALDIFKPLTDSNGEYGYIMGDHAYTQKTKSVLSQIEQSKSKDKGEEYNPALEKIVNSQMMLFNKLNDPKNWKSFYYNSENYSPGYDSGTKKEVADLTDRFIKMIGDGVEMDKPLGEGHTEIFKDKSIYADKFRDYLDANLSDRAKEQIKLNKKAEYWQNLSAYASIDNPENKLKVYNSLKDQYIRAYQDDINARLSNAEEISNKLEIYKKAADGNDKSFLKSINEQSELIKNKIEILKNKKITEEDVKPLLDINNWANGQDAYANYFADKELTKIANATATTSGVHKYETDQSYWNLQNLNLGWARFNEEKDYHKKELALKGLELDYKFKELNTPQNIVTTYDNASGNTISSPEDAGKQKLNNDFQGVATSNATFAGLKSLTGIPFQFKNEDLNKLSEMTFQQALDANIGGLRSDNDILNNLLKVTNVFKNGKISKINPNTDNATQVLTWLKTAAMDDRYKNMLTKTYNSSIDSDKRINFNAAKTAMDIENSKAKTIQANLQTALNNATNGVLAAGKPFSFYTFNLNDPASIENSLTDFAKSAGVNSKDLINKFYNNYDKLSSSKVLLKGQTQWDFKTASDKKGNRFYQNNILNLINGSPNKDALSDFIRDFSEDVNGKGINEQGFGVHFNSNISKPKEFIEAFNNLAGKDNPYGFTPIPIEKGNVDASQALNQLNSFFNTHKIPSSNIDTKQFEIDPNQEAIQKGIRLTGINLKSKDLKDIYGLTNQQDIKISFYNANKALDAQNLDIIIDGGYVIPKINNDGMIIRNQDGTVVTEYKSGASIKKDALEKAIVSYPGATVEQLQREINQSLTKDVSSQLTNLSILAYGNLDLIHYLNTSGKSVQKLTSNIKNKFINTK